MVDSKFYKNIEVGVNCVLSSISNIVSVFDKTVDDSVMFFFQDGFSLEYSGIEKTASLGDVYLKSGIMTAAHNFLQNKGICCRYDFANFNDIQSYIKERSQYAPFLIVADTTLLKYNRVYYTNTRHDHILTVYDIDENGIFFSDCFVATNPVSTYQGYMSVCDFEKAWKSAEYKFVDMDLKKLSKINFNITSDEIWCCVKRNLKEFLNNNIVTLYRFCQDISKYTDLYADNDIVVNTKKLGFNLRFESVVPNLELLKKSLNNLKANKDFGIQESMIQNVDCLIKSWMHIIILMIKASRQIEKGRFEKLSERTKEIVSIMERSLHQIIYKTY